MFVLRLRRELKKEEVFVDNTRMRRFNIFCNGINGFPGSNVSECIFRICSHSVKTLTVDVVRAQDGGSSTDNREEPLTEFKVAEKRPAKTIVSYHRRSERTYSTIIVSHYVIVLMIASPRRATNLSP